MRRDYAILNEADCASTAVTNQIRGFLLERGIAVRRGLRFRRQQLPEILAKRIDVLSPRMIRMVEDLGGDWRRLDERIEQVTEEIGVLKSGHRPAHRECDGCGHCQWRCLYQSRDFAAWLGLVPKQMSTGDRTILGRISKRGNRYLRRAR